MERVPAVSVCVPTYNYARFLPQLAESVLAQTFTDWEMVIVDDGSTDDTEAVARGYEARDPRIRYVRNARNLGMNPNLARTASLGRGKYLKILCGDDFLAPRCLEVMHGLMEAHPEAVIGTCAEFLADEHGRPECVQFLYGRPVSVIGGEAMLDRMAAGEGFGGNSSFFIRRDAYERVGGYDGTLLYAADYELAARLCRIGAYLHTDEPLFSGRRQPASSSSVNPERLLDVRDWFTIADKTFRPRPVGSREWRRYQRLTGLLTARYAVNYALRRLRGDHAYARELAAVMRERGNWAAGLPWLAAHAPARLARALTGRNRPVSRPLRAAEGGAA
jgi:glycosyltransferase involved in cell wall biosynthesis